jgi:predicted flap endonuclease-1-like 5' DNA nuclease
MIKLGLIKKWKQDDLKAVEGIGPKIAGLLQESGIKTWKALSNASVDKLNEVLTKAGPRFKLADPGTWPKQAQLADEGKWDELQEYQDFLDGGK